MHHNTDISNDIAGSMAALGSKADLLEGGYQQKKAQYGGNFVALLAGPFLQSVIGMEV